MGTRALTVMKNGDGEEIAVLYRQMDGYPSGHGRKLAAFLKDFVVVNGISLEDTPPKLANGMECLAAQLIAHFKEGVGTFYLYPAGTRDMWEEYTYIVGINDRGIYVEMESAYKGDDAEYFSGNVEAFLNFCKEVE